MMGRQFIFLWECLFLCLDVLKEVLNKENCIINDEFYLIQRFLGKGGGGIREDETKKPAF